MSFSSDGTLPSCFVRMISVAYFINLALRFLKLILEIHSFSSSSDVLEMVSIDRSRSLIREANVG